MCDGSRLEPARHEQLFSAQHAGWRIVPFTTCGSSPVTGLARFEQAGRSGTIVPESRYPRLAPLLKPAKLGWARRRFASAGSGARAGASRAQVRAARCRRGAAGAPSLPSRPQRGPAVAPAGASARRRGGRHAACPVTAGSPSCPVTAGSPSVAGSRAAQRRRGPSDASGLVGASMVRCHAGCCVQPRRRRMTWPGPDPAPPRFGPAGE